MAVTFGMHCATAMGMLIACLALCRSYASVAASLLLTHFSLLRATTDIFRAMTTRET